MVTEIMGLLILLGAAMVLAVRWHGRKQRKSEEDQQDMQYATEQLRQELERTGNEITARLESHVTRLERLLQDAERRRGALEGKIAELRELMHMGGQQMDAMRGLRSEIAGARQLQKQLMELRSQAVDVSPSLPQSIPNPPGSGTVEQDFSQVLQQSIVREEGRPMITVPSEDTAIPFPASSASPLSVPQKAEDEERQVEHLPVRMMEAASATENTDSAKARSLLMSGWTVDDVARETGLGRGAVELMQQMLRRKFAKEFPEE